jgi:hypothetical protein
MNHLIHEGRYKARMTYGVLQNTVTFPMWDLDLSFRLLGRVNPDYPCSMLPCPQVERTITSPSGEQRLALVPFLRIPSRQFLFSFGRDQSWREDHAIQPQNNTGGTIWPPGGKAA